MLMDYRWEIGLGPDAAALARMRRHAPMPRVAMGEAWFMGKQRDMFNELLECGDIGPEIEAALKPLEEIASGTSAFGPMDEWRDWFHYLLPRMISKASSALPSTSEISELLVTALVTQYPGDIVDQPHQKFREDVLETLGRLLMHESRWVGKAILRRRILRRGPYVSGMWYWEKPAGNLSSSLFLCCKYLQTDEIDAWFSSILVIEDSYWRAQVLIWLMKAYEPLHKEGWQPAEMGIEDGSWRESHCLLGNYSGDHTPPARNIAFLDSRKRVAIRDAIAHGMTPGRIAQWVSSIRRVEDLAWEVEGQLAELAGRGYALWPEAA